MDRRKFNYSIEKDTSFNFPKINLLLLLILFIFPVLTYSQTVTKVLISGMSGYTTHDNDVKQAFLDGYASYDGTQYTGQIDLHVDNSAYLALDYANQNNYQIVVRSYTGLTTTLEDTAQKYPNVLLFMPAGSNSFSYVCNLNIPNSAIVSTGAGLDSLVTGYRVEFFSIDPITGNNESSFSNGYIAGEIAYIANHSNISPQQARMVARNNTNFNYQGTNYVQYGNINIQQAVVNSSLPVEFTAFSASAIDNKVELKWKTATEVNNYGFEIERSAVSNRQSANAAAGNSAGGGLNAESWEKIGFVKGAGNSNSPRQYFFTDNLSNLSYFSDLKYRLKQIDNNGTFKYSKTINVSLSVTSKFTLMQNYPNPFNPTTVISFQIPVKSLVKLNVYNLLGEKVAGLIDEEEYPGKYSIEFSATKYNLASGIYIYSLVAGNFSSVKKFIIMK